MLCRELRKLQARLVHALRHLYLSFPVDVWPQCQNGQPLSFNRECCAGNPAQDCCAHSGTPLRRGLLELECIAE